MQLSHSRIETYKNCPRQFKYRYIDNLTTLPTDDPSSPLILGHALHTGIEKDVSAAIDEYYSNYPVINDNHITEALKLEYLIPKVKEILPEGLNEVKIEDEDFIGFIDYLVPIKYELTMEEKDEICSNCEKNCDCEYANSGILCKRMINQTNQTQYYDLYDFKYSNNVNNYLKSGQLHEYKYYFEKLNPGKRIRNLYFIFIPKCQLRIKYKNKTNPRDETIYEFRKRVLADLETKEIQIVKVDYDPNKVINFLINSKHAIEDTEYKKNETRLCDFCEFKRYCQDGIDYEIIKKEV